MPLNRPTIHLFHTTSSLLHQQQIATQTFTDVLKGEYVRTYEIGSTVEEVRNISLRVTNWTNRITCSSIMRINS